MPWREIIRCEPDAHCPCWYSSLGVCCVCGDYKACGHCGEPIVRAPGAAIWEHAVVLDEDEDDYHVPEPAEEVFDAEGCALPRPHTSAQPSLFETARESRRYEADWNLGPREPLRSTAQDIEISDAFL